MSARVGATIQMEEEELDFDDATSVAAMRSLGISKVVSFDRDFDGVEGISRTEPANAIPSREDNDD